MRLNSFHSVEEDKGEGGGSQKEDAYYFVKELY